MSHKVSLPARLKPLYPFDGKSWKSAWGDLHYLDEGSGFPVVMIHGNPTWSFYYRNLVLGLRGSYRCLVPDLPGCGLSFLSADYPARLENHIQLLKDWIDSLGLDSFHLIVHDWGGAIGSGLAAALGARVKRRVVMNTAAFRSNLIPLRIAACRWPLVGPLMVRGANAFVRASLTMTTVKPVSEAVKEAYLLPFADWESRRAVNAFVRDIPMSAGHPSYSALVRIEESLQSWDPQDVLFLWGMKDWCFSPEFLQEWKRKIPGAKIVELENAGHWLLEDEPENTLDVIKGFLDGMEANG